MKSAVFGLWEMFVYAVLLIPNFANGFKLGTVSILHLVRSRALVFIFLI